MDEKCSAIMLALLVSSLCTTPWCRSGEMPELSLPVDLMDQNIFCLVCLSLLPFRRLGIFRSLHRRPCSLSCINEYLAIDSGGNVSDLVLARNCCLARMLPGEAENGVGMNRSVREGKKCEAL